MKWMWVMLIFVVQELELKEVCPPRCSCFTAPRMGFVVNCHGQELTHVVRDINRATVVFDLSENNLTYLGPDAFPNLAQVTKLDVSHNQLQSLHEHTFISLTKLQTLDLSFNNFTYLPPNICHANKNLTQVFLKRNSLLILPLEPLFISKSLKMLNIAYCKITKLLVITFSQLSELTDLNLDGNELENLNVDVMKPMVKLRELHLSSICDTVSWAATLNFLTSRRVSVEGPTENICKIDTNNTLSTINVNFTPTPYEQLDSITTVQSHPPPVFLSHNQFDSEENAKSAAKESLSAPEDGVVRPRMIRQGDRIRNTSLMYWQLVVVGCLVFTCFVAVTVAAYVAVRHKQLKNLKPRLSREYSHYTYNNNNNKYETIDVKYPQHTLHIKSTQIHPVLNF